jgi:DNA excision repair protein ERCC-2
MHDIRTAVADGKVLLAQAPTGIGKTVATLSVLLEDALSGEKVIFFVTSKQSQHTIVIDTLRTIEQATGRRIRAVDIISRQSMCPDAASAQPAYAFREMCKARTKSRSCPYEQLPANEAMSLVFRKIMHVHELQRACVRAGFCPHKAAQEAMAEANVVVCDYNYIFDGIAEPILAESGKGLSDVLLVVDESHNLPDRIRSNLSLKKTSYELDQAMLEIGGKSARGVRYTKALKRWLDGRASKLLPGAEEYVDKTALEDELDRAFSEVLGQKDDLDQYISWLREIGEGILKSGAERSFSLELGDFLDTWSAGGSGVARIFSKNEDDSWALRIAFLEAEAAAGPVFANAGAAVLMSGTLCPPGMYADILGVPPERRMERIYSSPFPKENRLVLGLRGLTTQYTRRDETMYGRYAAAIMALSMAVKGNVAAFFTSYKFGPDGRRHTGPGHRRRGTVHGQAGPGRDRRRAARAGTRPAAAGGAGRRPERGHRLRGEHTVRDSGCGNATCAAQPGGQSAHGSFLVPVRGREREPLRLCRAGDEQGRPERRAAHPERARPGRDSAPGRKVLRGKVFVLSAAGDAAGDGRRCREAHGEGEGFLPAWIERLN